MRATLLVVGMKSMSLLSKLIIWNDNLYGVDLNSHMKTCMFGSIEGIVEYWKQGKRVEPPLATRHCLFQFSCNAKNHNLESHHFIVNKNIIESLVYLFLSVIKPTLFVLHSSWEVLVQNQLLMFLPQIFLVCFLSSH